MLRYKLSPHWTLTYREGELVINGGADQALSLELPSKEQSFFATLKHGISFTRAKTKNEVEIFEQLLAAQIIVPVMPSVRKNHIGILPTQAAQLFPSVKFVATEKADFLLLVRTNETYADLLLKIDYISIKKPHLFIDLAYHQTESIGPLVFPGETACVSCLQGRITDRWGDPMPPPQPLMTEEHLRLTEAIVSSELSKILKDKDYSLINTTVSWDIKGRNVAEHTLLTVPFCPVCNRTEFAASGQLLV